jgi:hypothetical protein
MALSNKYKSISQLISKLFYTYSDFNGCIFGSFRGIGRANFRLGVSRRESPKAVGGTLLNGSKSRL